jgi:hypothetical protein
MVRGGAIIVCMPESTSPIEGNEADLPVVLAYQPRAVASTAAVVWCRLLAICMLGWGVESSVVGLAEAIDYLPRSSFDARTLVMYFLALILPGATWLFLAWYCWAKAPVLADRMTRDTTQDASSQGMSADELLTTIIIGIGIYLLTVGLPSAVNLIYTELTMVRNGGRPMNGVSGTFVGVIVRCLLGIWLILGPQGILKIIRRHSGRWRDTPKSVA